MITPMTLQDALNDFLEKEVVSKHKLKAKKYEDGEDGLCEVDYYKNPKIVRSGWILPKSIDDEEGEGDDFPYIATRIGKIESAKGSRESIVTMIILYGIYDPGVYGKDGKRVDDGSGYRDFWNLVETTRQALFSQIILDKRYPIVEDFFEAEMLEEQEYPYWQGFCKTKWHVIFPVPQIV